MNDFRKLLRRQPVTEPPITLEEMKQKVQQALQADSQATSNVLLTEVTEGLSKTDGNKRARLIHLLEHVIESADRGRSRFGPEM